MFPRDKAGKFTVEGGTGKIITLCVVNGCVEIYKVDKAFRAKTPEGLDPDRINPNMPWVISEYSDYGCGHPFVARILLQSVEILKSVSFDFTIGKEKIIGTLSDFRDLLLRCEEIFQALKTAEDQINEKGVKMDELTRSINPFPQVKDLNDLCARFLVGAKRSLQCCSALIDYFYSTNIRSANFNKIRKWAKDNRGDKSYLYVLLMEYESELTRICQSQEFPGASE